MSYITGLGNSGYSGYSGVSGYSGTSGYSGIGTSGYSGYSGVSGYSGLGLSGYSGYSGAASTGGIVTPFTSQTSVTVTHNFGKKPCVDVIDDTNAVIVPLSIVHNTDDDFTVTFSTSTTGNIISTTGGGAGGGTVPVLYTESFTATASQTDFVLAHTPLAAGVIYVSRDGIVAKQADWSLSTATIIFGTGLDVNVEVQVAYWATVPTGTTPIGESFTATASQTVFTLAHATVGVLVVSVNGVVQKSTTWSASVTSLTFVTGLDADADVWISYLY